MKITHLVGGIVISSVSLIPLVSAASVDQRLTMKDVVAHTPRSEGTNINTVVTYNAQGECTGVTCYRNNDESPLPAKKLPIFQKDVGQAAPAASATQQQGVVAAPEAIDQQATPPPVAVAVPAPSNNVTNDNEVSAIPAPAQVATQPVALPAPASVGNATAAPAASEQIQAHPPFTEATAAPASENDQEMHEAQSCTGCCDMFQDIENNYVYFLVGLGLVAFIIYVTNA